MAEPVNRQALAALRPGAPLADVVQAYGSAFKPPPPHREGRILTIDTSDGVIARIDRDGKLGSISFNWRFGKDHPVLGLPMNASEQAIRARFPDAQIVMFPGGPFGAAKQVESPHLHVTLEVGTTAGKQRYLRSLTLVDPHAVYPPKQPVAFPAAESAPGAPFKDVNLKLAVLSMLMETAALDIGEPQDLYDHVQGRRFNLEAEGYRPVPAARDYLARLPLSQELLDKVTEIVFDGGSTIYRYVHYFWDGETDEFTVSSFEGLEALRNLKRIRIISMVDEHKADIAALRRRGIDVR